MSASSVHQMDDPYEAAKRSAAPYVPQVGDRVRLPMWLKWRWLDVIDVDAEHGLFYADDNTGDRSQWGYGLGWVKIDKPEPWPAECYIAERSASGLDLDYCVNVPTAVSACANRIAHQGVAAADLRIWCSNPDGSVTVLDHTGKPI